MAKKKRLKDLSEQEKFDLYVEGSTDPSTGEVSAGKQKKFVKKAYKKRKAEGTLGELDDPVVRKGRDAVKKVRSVVSNAIKKTPKQEDPTPSPKPTKKTALSNAVKPDEGYDLDYQQIISERSPKNVIYDNIAKQSLINPESPEVLEAEMAAAEKVDSAVLEEREQISKGISALDEAIKGASSAAEDAAQKTLITGDKVDDKITTESLITDSQSFKDLESEFSQDPNFQKAASEYMASLKKAGETKGSPAIEALGLQQYYPDISQPIAVGSYSRSMLGSGNIYVAGGGFVPMGVVDARKRALQGAAASKAKANKDFLKAIYATNGAIQYRDQIYNMKSNLIEKYGAAANWDLNALYGSGTELGRKFQEDLVNMRIFEQQTTELNTRSKAILDESVGQEEGQKGSISVSQEARNKAIEWMGGLSNIDDLYEKRDKVRNMLSYFKTHDDIIFNARQIAKEIEKDEVPLPLNSNVDFNDPEVVASYQDALVKSKNANYDEWISIMGKYVDTSRLKTLIDIHVDNGYYEDPEKAKNDMFQYVKSAKGFETSLTLHKQRHDHWRTSISQQRLDMKKDQLRFVTNSLEALGQDMNRAQEAYTMSSDANSRNSNFVNILGEKGFEPNTYDGEFRNGEIRSKINLPKKTIVKKANIQDLKIVSNRSKENVRDPDSGIVGAKNNASIASYQSHYLKNPEDGKKFQKAMDYSNDQMEAFMRLTGSEAVDQTLTGSSVGFGYRDPDGTFRVAKTTDEHGAKIEPVYIQTYTNVYTKKEDKVNEKGEALFRWVGGSGGNKGFVVTEASASDMKSRYEDFNVKEWDSKTLTREVKVPFTSEKVIAQSDQRNRELADQDYQGNLVVDGNEPIPSAESYEGGTDDMDK